MTKTDESIERKPMPYKKSTGKMSPYQAKPSKKKTSSKSARSKKKK